MCIVCLSTSSVTWLALIVICSTVMSSILLLSCLEAPPVAPSSIFCGLAEKEGRLVKSHQRASTIIKGLWPIQDNSEHFQTPIKKLEVGIPSC